MVEKLLNIEQLSLKIHLNQNKNFLGNLGTSFNLVLLENPWWIGSNEGDLEILDLRCEKYWILNFFSLKIQLNYKKWFWKEILLW
jgi:hypothetical protein